MRHALRAIPADGDTGSDMAHRSFDDDDASSLLACLRSRSHDIRTDLAKHDEAMLLGQNWSLRVEVPTEMPKEKRWIG